VLVWCWAAAQSTEAGVDPAKRLRNLRKKLREIEDIEKKLAAGEKLDKDQVEKASRKKQIQKEIASLEWCKYIVDCWNYLDKTTSL